VSGDADPVPAAEQVGDDGGGGVGLAGAGRALDAEGGGVEAADEVGR
jgi:hypothetical protein